MLNRYGRLQIEGTVLSKRLIAKLIDARIVRGFDDPRLFTLVGLRRRGVPPGAILSFVNELGVSTATTVIQVSRFEASVRRYLEQSVPRLMVVVDPLPVVLDNVPDDFCEMIANVPFSPKHPHFGEHALPFTKRVFIDRSDFREVDSKDYFRLAPGKTVGLLKVPFPIRATGYMKDEATGRVTEVRAVYERPTPAPADDGSAAAAPTTFKKPKTYIQWVADSPRHKSPVAAEVRFFNHLIKPAVASRASSGGGSGGDSGSGIAVAPSKEGQIAMQGKLTADVDPSGQSLEDGANGNEPVDNDDHATEATTAPAATNTSTAPESAAAAAAAAAASKTAFLNDINPSSEEVYPNAMVEIGLLEIRDRAPWPAEGGGEARHHHHQDQDGGSGSGSSSRDGASSHQPAAAPVAWETVRFQGLRVAYFCLDPDSGRADEEGKTKFVLNRIVSLKEDAGKAA